ncbi:BETA-like protein [Mya arenaria]|uniref:BETA-like protein n=1 Tax=Mya arenaria TaxID=6604 RepID=A0ABY7FMY6_MYAAR|nr:BETA-like protein [Mya arenaria]
MGCSIQEEVDLITTDGLKMGSLGEIIKVFYHIQIPELHSSSYHRRGGPIAVTYSPPSGLTPLGLKAGSELGYNVTDYNGEIPEGFSVVQSTLRNGIRSSTTDEFIAKEKRQNLDIVTRSFVTKINIQDKKANGVFFIRNGRKQYVKARKEIIVSTGAVNTPQLLMLSGIGPSKDLQKLDIEVVQDLPVGNNLQYHQITSMPSPADLISKWSELKYDFFKTGPLARTGVDGSAILHIDKAKIGKSAPDIQVAFFNFLFGENFFNFEDKIAQEYLHNTAQKQRLNKTEVSGQDPYDHPSIHANYYSNCEDINAVLGGIRIWEQLMETDTFREVGVDTSKTKVGCLLGMLHSTHQYHPCCTAPIGPDNDNSIANLRVIDASVFPNITSGNINAFTVMVAEKAADMIRGIDTVGEFKNRVLHFCFLLSGIGPSKDLQKLGIEVVQDLPIGNNLQDHQITIMPTPVKENVGPTWADLISKLSELMYDYLKTGPLAQTGLDGSAFLNINKAKIGKSSPGNQIIFLNFLFGENFLNFEDKIAQELMEKDFNKHGFVTDICTTRPKSRGSIKLRSADPFDYPSIRANYYSNYEDIKTVLGGIRIWEKLMETGTFRKVGVDTSKTNVSFCSQFEYRLDAYWECYIRHISTTQYHPCCTAPMGLASDNSAVLDLNLRVRGIANLQVIDSSVFPNITSGNLNAPTVTVADKASNMIRGIGTVEEFKNRV